MNYGTCKRSHMTVAFIAIGLSVGLLPAAHAVLNVDWYSMDAGGGETSGGTYLLRGTIGQLDAGEQTGGTYRLTGGFWAVPASRLGDITGDGKVNVFDLQRMASSWNKLQGQAGFDCDCDLNVDGKVNVFDLQILAANWNT